MTEQQNTEQAEKNTAQTDEQLDSNNAESQQENNSEALLTAKIQELESSIGFLTTELEVAKKNESEAMVRARAEIDNVRRRVEQDIDKARKFALEKFSTELLPVIDNLERALEATDKENPELKATVEGIELTLKSFLNTVKKFGIEVISTQEGQLNPDVHQAITMIDSPDHQSGQIVNTIQKGYTLNGRLIRPAMVIVAK